MINLKRSNGTLLQSQNVSVTAGNENGCKSIELTKGLPTDAQDGNVTELAPTEIIDQGVVVTPQAGESIMQQTSTVVEQFPPSSVPATPPSPLDYYK